MAFGKRKDVRTIDENASQKEEKQKKLPLGLNKRGNQKKR